MKQEFIAKDSLHDRVLYLFEGKDDETYFKSVSAIYCQCLCTVVHVIFFQTQKDDIFELL